MMNRLCACLVISLMVFSSCSTEEPAEESPFQQGDGGDGSIPGCNVELVKVDRITADEVTEDVELGDYLFTVKSIKTEKTSIEVEGRYAKDGAAVAIVTASQSNVGIDETIILKVNSKDINTEEDFNCMEYFVKVKAKGSSKECEFDGTDC